MKRVDYDAEQYQNYARGRALSERQLQTWVSAFEAVLPKQRPLAGLDVGSGTGRFTPRPRASVRASHWRRAVGPDARDGTGALPASRRPVPGRLRRGHASTVRRGRLRADVLVLAPRPGQAPGSQGAG